MDAVFLNILTNGAYLLALVNPASKILFMASQEPALSFAELKRVSVKSNMLAFLILLVFSIAGHFILQYIFHIELYSLKVAGGIVIFIAGLNAMMKGVFYQKDHADDAVKAAAKHTDDIAIVPLAAPLIAGPGTITAVVSFSTEFGVLSTVGAILLAMMVNFIFMLFALWINKVLMRFFLIGPIVRITGLIVAAVAVEMILGGIGDWIKCISYPGE